MTSLHAEFPELPWPQGRVRMTRRLGWQERHLLQALPHTFYPCITPGINFNGNLHVSSWNGVDWRGTGAGVGTRVWGLLQKSRRQSWTARQRRAGLEREGSWRVCKKLGVKWRGSGGRWDREGEAERGSKFVAPVPLLLVVPCVAGTTCGEEFSFWTGWVRGALEPFKGTCQLGSCSVRPKWEEASGPSPNTAETLVYGLRFKPEQLGAWGTWGHGAGTPPWPNGSAGLHAVRVKPRARAMVWNPEDEGEFPSRLPMQSLTQRFTFTDC